MLEHDYLHKQAVKLMKGIISPSDNSHKNFTMLEGLVEAVKDRAIKIDTIWWPVSQMAMDGQKRLWVRTWVYEKNYKPDFNKPLGKNLKEAVKKHYEDPENPGVFFEDEIKYKPLKLDVADAVIALVKMWK